MGWGVSSKGRRPPRFRTCVSFHLLVSHRPSYYCGDFTGVGLGAWTLVIECTVFPKASTLIQFLDSTLLLRSDRSTRVTSVSQDYSPVFSVLSTSITLNSGLYREKPSALPGTWFLTLVEIFDRFRPPLCRDRCGTKIRSLWIEPEDWKSDILLCQPNKIRWFEHL